MRARPVDNSKALTVLLAEDVPDIHEATSVQRSLPQMATGMEKEEEEVCAFIRVSRVFIGRDPINWNIGAFWDDFVGDDG